MLRFLTLALLELYTPNQILYQGIKLAGRIAILLPRPEYFDEKNVTLKKTKKFDVYGFAISAWEIFSGKRAYYDFAIKEILPVHVVNGHRPKLEEINDTIPESIQILISKCWQQSADDRPTFPEVRMDLSGELELVQEALQQSRESLTDQEAGTTPNSVYRGERMNQMKMQTETANLSVAN